MKRTIIVVAAVVLLFFLNITSLGDRARSRVIFLLSPLSSRLFSFSHQLTVVKSYFKGYKSLAKENDELRRKNVDLEQALVASRLVLFDLDAARTVTIFSDKRGFEIVPARIITKTSSEQILSFILDKGARDTIEDGQIVVWEDGILAGRIIDVDDDYSVFRFVTDEASRFTAGISGKANVAGEVRGRLGLGLNLELVPRELVLVKDDLVITAGLESGVPDGLIIGKVLQIFDDPQNPLQRALLQPAANLNELRSVGVIRQVYKP
jgi:rod shape-determining protein MreC